MHRNQSNEQQGGFLPSPRQQFLRSNFSRKNCKMKIFFMTFFLQSKANMGKVFLWLPFLYCLTFSTPVTRRCSQAISSSSYKWRWKMLREIMLEIKCGIWARRAAQTSTLLPKFEILEEKTWNIWVSVTDIGRLWKGNEILQSAIIKCNIVMCVYQSMSKRKGWNMSFKYVFAVFAQRSCQDSRRGASPRMSRMQSFACMSAAM